jgi:SAM-dependent methyltransferase
VVNTYSQTWFELFLETRPYTEQEAAFVARQLPKPPFTKVLDLCCGPGRLTNCLAERGYEMVGVDIDGVALERAQARASVPVTYLQRDMREVGKLPGSFDAALCLWQSFGYFDAEANRSVLAGIAQKLRPGGRFILDLYHGDYWREHGGVQRLEKNGVGVRVTNAVREGCLTARLEYEQGGGEVDTFDWLLYTPESICNEAAAFGLRCVLACTECDEAEPATAEKPSMQLMFER